VRGDIYIYIYIYILGSRVSQSRGLRFISREYARGELCRGII
jgi:hypothetical protein